MFNYSADTNWHRAREIVLREGFVAAKYDASRCTKYVIIWGVVLHWKNVWCFCVLMLHFFYEYFTRLNTVGIETDVKVLKTVGEKTPSQGSYGHMEVGERTGIIHQKHISNFTGHRWVLRSNFICYTYGVTSFKSAEFSIAISDRISYAMTLQTWNRHWYVSP